MYFLVVNFNKTAAYQMIFAGIIFSDGYDLTKRTRNDAFALLVLVATHHRVCLATACLPVCEDGPIVSIQHIVDQRECALLVDQTLRAVRPEDIVEREAFGLLFVVFSDEIDLFVGVVDFNDAGTAWISIFIPRSFSLWFMGLQRTMTLTASDIIEIKFNNRLLSLFRLKE